MWVGLFGIAAAVGQDMESTQIHRIHERVVMRAPTAPEISKTVLSTSKYNAWLYPLPSERFIEIADFEMHIQLC